MSLGERIKKVRKALDLTQREFSNRIGTTANVLTNYETGRRNPSATAFNNICKIFNISEKWLRTGEGEMFESSPEKEISELVRQHRLSDLEKQIIIEFIRLDARDRQGVLEYIKRLASSANREKLAHSLLKE